MNNETITSYVNKVVKVDRGGKESRVGKLLGCSQDYFVLLTEDDGVVFYQTHHVKSITQNTKDGIDFSLVIPEDFTFVQGEDFKGLLTNLKHHWVKINRGGPESLEGILDDVTADFITVIKNEEIISLNMFHIRNVSYGLKLEKPEQKESDSKDNDKEKADSKEKSNEKSEGKEKSSEKHEGKEKEKENKENE
ncbi:hypothetical protein [Metabacillus sp. RGM 3146]|uniref:hypothetical protein n=1 Tax=Metabacillus sp. RGM 3146 TaxID=3401092 RepID=UPI003B99F976